MESTAMNGDKSARMMGIATALLFSFVFVLNALAYP
jgi:tetrahydromethanopterin S-methyltransferase subunit F